MTATGAPRASFCILALALGAAACGKAPLGPAQGSGTGAPRSGYQVVDLGHLGGGWTVPEALTDDGRVVGTSITASGVRRGFLYENGVMRALAESGPFARNEAQAINPAGQIAGIESGLHAVLIWDGVTGAPRRLDTGASAPPATRIIGFNERGDVLVRLDNNHYDVRATLWRDGVAQELGGLGTRGWTYANAWNSRGEVIGSSWVRNVAPTYEIWPMMTFIKWRIRSARGETIDASAAPAFARVSFLEAALVVLMVLAAAAMARGFGAGTT
ncbi:MAG: DUF2214 family protein [Gemmatimonadales bacterium]